MKSTLLLAAVLAAGTTLCLTNGCTVYAPGPPVGVEAEVDVSGDPPPLIVEPIPVSPGPDFIWVGGAWVWNGQWVWEHGRWARPPHPGAVWVPHRYEVRNGRHVFIRGGWR